MGKQIQSRLALAAVVAVLCFTGCSARQVVRTSDYGVVAIPSNTNAWPMRYRDKAHKIMSEHFPGGYEIVREEEHVTGQSTHYDVDRDEKEVELIDDFFSVGHTDTRATVTETDVTEYRIHYRKLGSGRPPRFGREEPRPNPVRPDMTPSRPEFASRTTPPPRYGPERSGPSSQRPPMY